MQLGPRILTPSPPPPAPCASAFHCLFHTSPLLSLSLSFPRSPPSLSPFSLSHSSPSSSHSIYFLVGRRSLILSPSFVSPIIAWILSPYTCKLKEVEELRKWSPWPLNCGGKGVMPGETTFFTCFALRCLIAGDLGSSPSVIFQAPTSFN